MVFFAHALSVFLPFGIVAHGGGCFSNPNFCCSFHHKIVLLRSAFIMVDSRVFAQKSKTESLDGIVFLVLCSTPPFVVGRI